MNRNKAAIYSTDQILTAARAVYVITKLLKMTRTQWDDMYHSDVVSKIARQDATVGELFAFANGVKDAYVTVILTEHCEFVYYHDGVKLSVKEVIQQGPGVREQCICGHQWLDSEFNFTTFVEEADPWI